MDGFLNNTGTMGATAGSASVTLGSSAGGINHMECDITAWIVYDRALSKSEIYEMEVYLNDQYSLGFSILSPMLPSPPIPDFPTLDIGFDAILGYWDVDPQTSVRDAADDMCEHGDTVTTWYDLAQKTPPFSGYPNLTGSATYRRPEPNGKGYIRFADTETLAYNSFPFGGWYGDNHTWIVVGRLHTAGSGTNILAELSHNGANAEQLTENVTGGSFEYGVAGSTYLVGPLDLDWHIWTFRTRAGTALSRAKYDGAQGSNNMPWNNGAVAGATTTSIQLGDSAAGAGALWDVCAVILVNGEVEWEDEMRLEHYFNNKFQLGRSCISDPDRPLSELVAPGNDGYERRNNHFFLRARSQNWPGCAVPTDTNDGRDPLGIGLTNATYDHTGNAKGERSLTEAGAFTNYEHVMYDQIHLFGDTGVLNGLYYIIEKVDNDTVLLLANDALTADEANLTSSTGPWRSAQYAADTVTSGRLCHWCQDVVGRGNKNVQWDTNTGAENDPIIHRGASQRGHVDGTRCVQTMLNCALNDDQWDFATTALTHLWFENFVFDGAGESNARHGCYFTANHDMIRWTNCRWTNGFDSAIYTTLNKQQFFVDCEIDNCAQTGIEGVSADGVWHMYNCDIHHNGYNSNWGYGMRVPFEVHLHNCRFFYNRNTGLGVHDQSRCYIRNCIFAKNGKASFSPAGDWYGIIFYGTNDQSYGVLDGCIFYDNDAGGIAESGGHTTNLYLGHNWFYETGYNYYNGTAEVYAEAHSMYDPGGANGRQSGAHQTLPSLDVDPQFMSVTEDYCDFRLKRSSPVWDWMWSRDIYHPLDRTRYQEGENWGGRNPYDMSAGPHAHRDAGKQVDARRKKMPVQFNAFTTQPRSDRFALGQEPITRTKQRRY
jgi:hypothetical protein